MSRGGHAPQRRSGDPAFQKLPESTVLFFGSFQGSRRPTSAGHRGPESSATAKIGGGLVGLIKAIEVYSAHTFTMVCNTKGGGQTDPYPFNTLFIPTRCMSVEAVSH